MQSKGESERKILRNSQLTSNVFPESKFCLDTAIAPED